MVTCDPNELVAPIRPGMITILAKEDWDHWPTCSYNEVVKLQRPYPADRMTARWPGSRRERSEKRHNAMRSAQSAYRALLIGACSAC
jgi:putative SOS response-associated peptidase YedK